MMGKLKAFTSSSLFLPIVALFVLLLFNTIFVDGFLSIQMTEDGRLYGRLIDILNRSSSLIILALGMTFVIATSGIDISVGAVVAISAAVVCTLIGGRGDGIPEHPMLLAMLAGRLGTAAMVGLFAESLGIHAAPLVYIGASLLKGLPGIVIQLCFIPLLMGYLNRNLSEWSACKQ